MKLYVITETASHYNDEYYTMHSGDGGKPVTAFSTKEKARDEIKRLTAIWIAENDIFNYSEDYQYVISDPYSFAETIGLKEKEFNELIENWQQDEIYKLMKGKEAELAPFINLTPYEITEITLEDS